MQNRFHEGAVACLLDGSDVCINEVTWRGPASSASIVYLPLLVLVVVRLPSAAKCDYSVCPSIDVVFLRGKKRFLAVRASSVRFVCGRVS